MFSATTKEAASLAKDMAANDIKKTAKNAKQEADSLAAGVMEDLTGYANQAGRTVRDFVDSASCTITDSTKQVKDQIETNPMRSSIIALGIGFILGAMFRR